MNTVMAGLGMVGCVADTYVLFSIVDRVVLVILLAVGVVKFCLLYENWFTRHGK